MVTEIREKVKARRFIHKNTEWGEHERKGGGVSRLVLSL